MTQQAQTSPTPPSREWFWRLLAALMLLLACWVGWVAYQIMPSSLVTPVAYQAFSQARSANVQEGVIRPAAPPARSEAKLRLAESIQTPIQAK